MPNTALTQVRFGPWFGGSKPDYSPFVLEPSDIQTAVNVEFREDGSIRKRRGYVKWSTSDPAGASWGRRLWAWRNTNSGESNGNDFLFYLDTDNELYYVNATTGTTLTRANSGGDLGLGTNFASATALNDIIYFTSRGTSADALSFNGTAWTDIADITLNGSGSEYALASFSVTHNERIFLGYLKTGGSNFNSRIWWSNAGDGDTFGSTSWIDFDPSDGSALGGLAVLGDRLVVFKDFSFYTLSGVDPDSFTVFKVSPDVGCFSGSQSIAQLNGVVYWFDFATLGVYGFDGSSFDLIDSPIRERIRQGVTAANFKGCHGFTFNDKYHLSLDWEEAGPDSDGRTKHTFVYDPRQNTWTEYDLGVQATAKIGSTLYAVGPSVGDATPATGIFKLFEEGQVDDNGSSINAHFHTPWYAPNNDFTVDFRPRRIQVYIRGESSNPATVAASLHTDWDSTTEVSSVNISNSSTDDYVVGEIQPATTPVQAVSFHVENNSTDEWEVSAIDCVISRRKNEQGVES